MVAYSKKVMEHFMNPRNVGEIKDADALHKAIKDYLDKRGK